MTTRKQRGHDSQRIVADYLRANGFPHAESAGAGRPGSDITGIVGCDVEIKARRGIDLGALMRQQAARSGDTLAFGVVRLDGQGPASVAEWPVVLPLGVFVMLLRGNGYGEPL